MPGTCQDDPNRQRTGDRLERIKRGGLLAAGALASAVYWGDVNYRNWHRPVSCDDCFFPYGVPFTFYRNGGFAGGNGFVWTGVAGNLLVVAASALLIGGALQMSVILAGKLNVARMERDNNH